jgi:hypothetical protein
MSEYAEILWHRFQCLVRWHRLDREIKMGWWYQPHWPKLYGCSRAGCRQYRIRKA